MKNWFKKNRKTVQILTLCFMFAVFLFTDEVVPEKKLVAAELDKVSLSAFEIMDKVDLQLKQYDGLNRAQLTLTAKNGKVSVYKINHYRSAEDSLMLIDSLERGRVFKVLLKENGENIYVYDALVKRLYHKKTMDKYEYLLSSGISYFDLANLRFMDNYTPRINGTENNYGKQLLRIENIPLDKSHYSRLNVLVDHNADYKLERIDYYDKSGVLLKSLRYFFAPLPVKEKDGASEIKTYPVKLEVAEMATGVFSIYENLLLDKGARMDSVLFDLQNIER